MFAVLNVREPNTDIETRLVFGCFGPAEACGCVLAECGYEVVPEALPIAPLRSPAEVQRAAQIMELVLSPAAGNA